MNSPTPSTNSGSPPVDLVVDGHRANLVEVSPSHALVHLDVALKPDQRVRVVLKAKGSVLRTHARVTSAKYEIPKEGARYRVHLAFDEGDSSAIERLMDGQPQ